MKNPDDKDTHTLDIVTHEVGLLEMQDGRSTPDDQRWAQDYVASMRAKIGEYRKNRLPATVPIKKAEPLSARLKEMTRAALEALFGSLMESWGPKAQVAHRQLDDISDNDLRRLIQTIENHTKQE